MSSSSTLYAPYKAVGVVSDGKPFSVNRLGEETFITTSIGSCFQVYRLDRLTCCLVSRSTPGEKDMQCLTTSGHETFAAVGTEIYVYDRTRVVNCYSVHEATIVGLCMVGRMLLSFDEDNKVHVIDTKSRCVVSGIEPLLSQSLGTSITAVVHPATYLNKFVLGYSNGGLELWNVSKRTLVYTFQSHLAIINKKRKGGGEAASESPSVTCLEQSPANDVVAVGFSSGHIILLNLKLDQVLFFYLQQGGGVTSLSFRTDVASTQFPFLVSASTDGRLHIWNLGTKASDDSEEEDAEEEDEEEDEDEDEDEDGEGEDAFRSSRRKKRGGKKTPTMIRKLQSTIDEAHSSSISKVHFLHGEPIMISSAGDNTLKVWIFDSPDGTARLLKSREGHSGNPVKIRFYGGTTNMSMRENSTAESCELISSGSDGTLRLFNTAIESQNMEMSQKPILKKLGLQRRHERLPVTIDFDYSETRQRDWANLVTIHKNHSNAYLWKYKHRVVTEMILRQPTWHNNDKMYSVDRSLHSTAVAMSPCGNFVVIGSRGGIVYLYNVQSGIPRGSFPPSSAAADGPSIKAGLIKQRGAMPGNVLYENKMIMGEGKAVGANSLNPKKLSKEEVAAAAASAASAAAAAAASAATLQHSQEVRGLFIDLTSSIMMSCGLDGLVIFWNFGTKKALHSIPHSTPQLMLHGFRDGNFAAVAGQDRVVRVYDMASFKLSRRFANGHSREITDLAFTPDGRRLLSSASDCTLRVWDMPTGRCLSWLLFDAPVLSIAMSLSGESLCLAQGGKEGIYVYLDRSLYETLHFWQEPTAPTRVVDSSVKGDEGAGAGAGGGEEGGDADADEKMGEDDEETRTLILPPQGQAVSGEKREQVAQRGSRTITMSTLPPAYWSSLFHLEAIKKRNAPRAAPAPAPAAPFFLPTINKGGGGTPSFPTPSEYAALQKSIQKSNSGGGGEEGVMEEEEEEGEEEEEEEQTGKGKGNAKGGKRGRGGDEAGTKLKKAKKGSSGSSSEVVMDEEARVLAELASMSSAWNDGEEGEWGGAGGDDDDEEWGPFDAQKEVGGEHSRILNTLTAEKEVKKASASSSSSSSSGSSSSSSRIINRKTALPRCKLVAYLLAEEEALEREGEGGGGEGGSLKYLMTLAPPAVDLQIRSLCNNAEDREGISLLSMLLSCLQRRMSTGLDFEVLEAYLHRVLLVYGDVMLSVPSLQQQMAAVKETHAAVTKMAMDFNQTCSN